MLIDAQNQFSDAQALTASARSTNIIDLSEARQIQEGEAMGILITVDVAADFTTGNETYQIDLQTDTASGGAFATTVFSQVLTAAQLTLGAKIFLPIPNLVALKEFIQLYFTLGGTTPSVTVTAELQPKSMVDEFRSYPNAYTIS